MKHYQLHVRAITRETADAITITLDHPADGGKLLYRPGQFLTLLVEVQGEQLRRAYSFCTAPATDEYPAITVKRTPNGKVSNYLNDHLRVGDTLEILEPMGVFTTEFDRTQQRHLVLVGGGSGITPLMALLKATLKAEPESVVSLIYANRDKDSVIFAAQLEQYEREYKGRFQTVHIWEKAPLFWSKGYKGLLNTKILGKILGSLPKFAPESTEYFMCGPTGMMNAVQKAFSELQLPLDALRKESFGLAPEEAAARESAKVSSEAVAPVAGTYDVVVRYDGEEYTLSVPPDKTILQVALSRDIDLPYSCQSGMCTACMGRCVQGKVQLDEEDALTAKELAQGFVLTCVGHPLTPDVIIEID